MGYAPDSGTIRDAITTAEERGLSVSFQASSLDMGHPNVAEIKMKGKSGRMATVVGRSLGGGRVMITEIDGFPVESRVRSIHSSPIIMTCPVLLPM